jgi:hypothetical protein
MHGRDEKFYKILVVKPEGKRPLARPMHRCEIILKWILHKKLVPTDVDCTRLA